MLSHVIWTWSATWSVPAESRDRACWAAWFLPAHLHDNCHLSCVIPAGSSAWQLCLGILGVSEDFGVECNRGIWKDNTTWNVFSADWCPFSDRWCKKYSLVMEVMGGNRRAISKLLTLWALLICQSQSECNVAKATLLCHLGQTANTLWASGSHWSNNGKITPILP